MFYRVQGLMHQGVRIPYLGPNCCRSLGCISPSQRLRDLCVNHTLGA